MIFLPQSEPPKVVFRIGYVHDGEVANTATRNLFARAADRRRLELEVKRARQEEEANDG
jgi:hypothetical protein